jgi:hypothetical protein
MRRLWLLNIIAGLLLTLMLLAPACLFACLFAVVEEPPLHVVHVAVEMAPICKVGGRVAG